MAQEQSPGEDAQAIVEPDLGIATITPKAAGDYREVVVR